MHTGHSAVNDTGASFRDAEFESISNSSNNILKGDADNYKPMKASMTEWERNEVFILAWFPL